MSFDDEGFNFSESVSTFDKDRPFLGMKAAKPCPPLTGVPQALLPEWKLECDNYPDTPQSRVTTCQNPPINTNDCATHLQTNDRTILV
jgi:hypothetical protein